MIVPTVPATTARRNCRLCSASDRALAVISAVLILFPPPFALIGYLSSRLSKLDHVVFFRDVLVGVVRQQRCRDDADDGAAEDVKRNRQTRSKGGEQRSRDERRGAAGDDRGELIAERAAAVAQPRGEAFRDQRRFGAV